MNQFIIQLDTKAQCDILARSLREFIQFSDSLKSLPAYLLVGTIGDCIYPLQIMDSDNILQKDILKVQVIV